jgi:hypothetical protein
MEMAMVNSYQDWVELYKSSFSGNLIWRNDHQMIDILESQKQKLIHSLENSLNAIMRTGFTKADRPVQSHTLFRELVVPEIVKRQAYLVCGNR